MSQTIKNTLDNPAAGAPDLRQVILDFAPYLHIAHQIAGRIRFKVDASILDSPILKKYGTGDLGDALGSVRGVKQIKTNLLARSCVVEYDNQAIPDSAWSDVLAGRNSAAADILLSIVHDKYEEVCHDQLR